MTSHPSPSPPATADWAVSLGLLSAGVTAAQIAVMQLLSCMQWHHFAYFVVAVAMLGYGASGTVLSLARERLWAAADTLPPWLMLAAGLTFATTPALLQWDFLRFDLYLLFVEPTQWLRLTAACVVLALPFFCAGLASGVIMTVAVAQAGRLYFANLTGAGLGALGGLALLEWFEPARLPGMIAVLPLLGALAIGSFRRNRPARVWMAAALTVSLALAWRAAPPVMSPFKDLARTLELPDSRITVSQPSAQGWLQLVAAPALRGGPPAALDFTGPVPRQIAVFIDGNRRGSIIDDARADSLAVFTASAEALPWQVSAPRRALLLHDGAGGEAAFAQQQGATDITLVEPHRRLARLLAQHLEHDGAVHVTAEEPRLALARTPARYDLIRFPTVGVFGGSAGLRAVGEEFLLTREAIAAAWRALTEDGSLCVTAWMDHPERNALRLLNTLVAGLRDVGVTEARQHLAAVRGWASVTFLLRRRPLDAGNAGMIRAFAEARSFDLLLLPGLQADERERFHVWDNPGFFSQVEAIVSDSPGASSLDGYVFRLAVPTDERPYFAQFMRLRSVRALAATHGLSGVPFFELGSIVVAGTFGVLLLLAVALILLPLVRSGWSRDRRSWTLGYFASLGLGFMAVEMVLMQRLTPLLGGAVPAAAIVLATLLASAGVGSYWSQRRVAQRRTLVAITSGAAVGIGLLGVATRWLPIDWDAAWCVRAAVCVALIAPVGCVLGMAFPVGLRHLAIHAPSQLPWAWAINNCLSVITPSLATLLAVSCGYSWTFALAAGVYAIAAGATSLTREPRTLQS